MELECANNLLCVYQEFFCEECPEENDNSRDAQLAALVFSGRVRQYCSLIDAAQTKINAMCKEMAAAIKPQSRESKKKGGDAA